MQAIRWLLLPPAVIAAWCGVALVGLFIHSLIERRLCPPEDLISGNCTNETVVLILEFTLHFFVAASAVAVMCTATPIAPAHRKETAWLTLLGGIAFAAYLATATREWGLFLSAIVGGLAGLVLVRMFVSAEPGAAGAV